MNENNDFWALHAVIFKKPYELEKAKEEIKNFIKDGKKHFYRETNKSYRFRNISKNKFIKKNFRTKKINSNISIVMGKLKPEYSHLEGAGIFDLFKKSAKHVSEFFKNPIQKVKEILTPRQGYNNTTTKNLNNYGNLIIKRLTIVRTPIMSVLDKAVNLISFGKWASLKKEYGFDKLFHLALIANLGTKNLVIEKNEVINVDTSYKMSSNTESLDVPINGKNITINGMLNKTRQRMGDSLFFGYEGFNNNCQVFVKQLLESEGLYGESEKNFLFQDLSELVKKFPSFSRKIMKGITNTGAIVNKLTGQGEPFSMNDFTLKQLKQIVNIYNDFIVIDNIDSATKEQLVQELEKHLYINDEGLNLKEHSFEIIKPKKVDKPKKVEEPKKVVEPIQDYSKEQIPANKRKCECGMITGISSQSIKNHNKTPIHQDYLKLIREEPIGKDEQFKIMEMINGILSNKYGTRMFHHYFNALDKKYPFIADNIMKIYTSKKGFDFYPTPTEGFNNPTAKRVIEHSDKILEPTAGLGAIITVLLHYNEHAQIEGNELNKDFIPILKKIFENDNRVFINNYDFLEKDYTNNNYDLIVCNPPFTKGTDNRFYYMFLFKCLQILNESKGRGIKKLLFISPQLIKSDNNLLNDFRRGNLKKNENMSGWQFDLDSLLSKGYISLPVIKKVYEQLLNINMYKDLEKAFKLIIKGLISVGDRGDTSKKTINKKTGEEEYKEFSDDVCDDLDKFEYNFEFGFGEIIKIIKGFGGTGITAEMTLFEVHNNLYGGNKLKIPDLAKEFKKDEADHNKKLLEFEKSMPSKKVIKDVLHELKHITDNGLSHINKLKKIKKKIKL